MKAWMIVAIVFGTLALALQVVSMALSGEEPEPTKTLVETDTKRMTVTCYSGGYTVYESRVMDVVTHRGDGGLMFDEFPSGDEMTVNGTCVVRGPRVKP